MSSPSIAALLQPVTADQVRAGFVTGLVGLGIPADQWRSGGMASTILTIVARSYAAFWTTILAVLNALFLETASGTWLIYIASWVYGVTAIAATFATGTLTLTNTGGGIYTYAAGQATFINPSTGVTYTNVAGFALNATSTLTIQVQATTLGSAGNATPGAISQLQTAMLGVTCTNASAIVGLDQEADAALRQRCLNKLAALSVRGPRMSYAYAAVTNPDGTPLLNSGGSPVNINRIQVSTSSSTGQTTVYLASPSGAPTTDDLTTATANMNLYARPEAVTLSVFGVTPVAYSPSTFTAWCTATPGLTAAAVQSAIADAIEAFLATWPISGLPKPPSTQGYLWASAVEGVVKGAHPSIYAVDGITTDVLLTLGQVVTDNVSLGAINVRLVSQ